MKKFLIIGNINAVTCKEIFPLVKENKIWLGVNSRMNFILQDKNSISNINSRWFTNLPNDSHNTPITLTQTFSSDKYFKYNNYNAINVDKTKDIPKDYYGVMGVPITYLTKHCPEQFEIIGGTSANVLPDGWSGMTKEFIDLYYSQGGTSQLQVGNYLAYYITKDGKAKIPYKRILIKRKI